MGYSPKKKALKNKQPKPDRFAGFRVYMKQKWPVLFFVLGFAVLMILFYAVMLSDFFQQNLQPGIMGVYSGISSAILNLFGMNTVANKENISSAVYTISIARGCDALEAIALFSSALLAFPAKWKYKIIGFCLGVAALFILNIVRIVSLFLIGKYYPKAFEFMHVEVWQAIFIIFAIGLWIFWIKGTKKEKPHAAE